MAEILSNRYVLVKPIGEGGMATVYLAIDNILKREVAIKILKGNLAEDKESLERFQREARALASTSHPNIVEIYDVGEDQGKNYIVMEYVHGKTLKQLIRQRGVLPVDEAVNIMKQLVSATENAHKNNILHRDIKSQNVLVKDDGTVKLTDFGIAQIGEAAQRLTRASTVLGSVHYLSPELASGKSASVQSDIYALGIVFYELLTGDVPFHGDTAVEIALKHLHDPIPSVRDFNPGIPQSIENIVIRATAKDPKKRYDSAETMFNDLVTCLDYSRNQEEKLMLEEPEKPLPASRVEKNHRSRNSNSVTPLLVVFATLLSAALLALIIAINGGFTPKSAKVTIPDLENVDIEEAEDTLKELGLTIEDVVYVATDDLEKGKVVSTSPSKNSEVNKNSSVVITVSSGKNFTVENYLNRKIDEVKELLEKEGFTVKATFVVPSNNEKYGTILSQSVLPNTVFAPDATRTIEFEIADYQQFLIPNVIGQDVEKAQKTLENLGAVVDLKQLPIEENTDESGEYIHPLSTVIKTSPAVNSYYIQTEDTVLTLYYY